MHADMGVSIEQHASSLSTKLCTYIRTHIFALLHYYIAPRLRYQGYITFSSCFLLSHHVLSNFYLFSLLMLWVTLIECQVQCACQGSFSYCVPTCGLNNPHGSRLCVAFKFVWTEIEQPRSRAQTLNQSSYIKFLIYIIWSLRDSATYTYYMQYIEMYCTAYRLRRYISLQDIWRHKPF